MRVEYQQEHIQISLASISKALIINHVRINNNYSYITVYHILSVYRYGTYSAWTFIQKLNFKSIYLIIFMQCEMFHLFGKISRQQNVVFRKIKVHKKCYKKLAFSFCTKEITKTIGKVSTYLAITFPVCILPLQKLCNV